MFPECCRHMVSGFGWPGMSEAWSCGICLPAPCPQTKVTVLAGHHSCAGIKGDGDSEALLQFPLLFSSLLS